MTKEIEGSRLSIVEVLHRSEISINGGFKKEAVVRLGVSSDENSGSAAEVNDGGGLG